MLIQVQDLSYTYALGTPLASVALRGVSLEVMPGERVGLLGPTGSGKSTLAQLAAGLLDPTEGRVLLDGIPARGRGAAARSNRMRVGMAFQYPEHQIFEQTVFAEVAYGARQQGARGDELKARVAWALDLVGIEPLDVLGRSPLSLSGGEMRRIALASILVRRPDVLILDEPTANLDPQGRRDLLARLIEWQTGAKTTLIAISHNLDDLARIADRVILLVDGTVAADGPTTPVLSDPVLLGRAGIEVPGPMALLRALREAGWTVPVNHLLPGDVAADIARAAKRRGRVV